MGIFSRLFAKKEQPIEPDPTPAPNTRKVSHGIVGTSYREDAIWLLGKKNPDFELDKRGILKRWPQGETVYEYTFGQLKAELVPEPENPHDPKAIKVLIEGVHVGYIKAGSCARVHKLIRENRIQKIEPRIFGGKYKAVFSLDADPRSSADFEFEKGTQPLCIRLEITELLAEH